MSVRLWSMLVWASVGASVVYWGLQLWVRPQALPLHMTEVQPAVQLQTSLAVLSGNNSNIAATPNPVAAAAGRFVLVGVVSAPGAASASPAGDGVALIAVDGKPARTFAVGARVDDSWVLQAVSRRAAQLGPPGQAGQLQLNIPDPPAAARSSKNPPRP